METLLLLVLGSCFARDFTELGSDCYQTRRHAETRLRRNAFLLHPLFHWPSRDSQKSRTLRRLAREGNNPTALAVLAADVTYEFDRYVAENGDYRVVYTFADTRVCPPLAGDGWTVGWYRFRGSDEGYLAWTAPDLLRNRLLRLYHLRARTYSVGYQDFYPRDESCRATEILLRDLHCLGMPIWCKPLLRDWIRRFDRGEALLAAGRAAAVAAEAERPSEP